MSVFGDFQRVWVDRFPDSALPAAWEEGVKANLETHKQKVKDLREELEKEDFYVEYLERLLADVEHHKELAKVSSENNPSNPAPNENLTPSKQKDLIKFQDKCVSELSSTLSSNKRPKGEIPTLEVTKSIDPRRDSNPEIESNYVTVIEVTGKKENKNQQLKNKDEINSEKSIEEDDEKEGDEEEEEVEVEEEEEEIDDEEVSEEEPYYDNVHCDNSGEYVYINADTRIPPCRAPVLSNSPQNQNNYVNMDFFIQHRVAMDSEDEEGPSPAPPILLRTLSMDNETGSSDAEPLSLSEGSLDSPTPTTPRKHDKVRDTSDDRVSMVKCIINSVVDSEEIYVRCLSIMLQYMKGIRATLNTSQPVITEKEFAAMFYKIPELHSSHESFLNSLKKKMETWDANTIIGEEFKMLAMDISLYGAFLYNYATAIDAVRTCSTHSIQFGEMSKDIRLLNGPTGTSVSLEDLLHKPVARVQKNTLVLNDLLKHTPTDHPDYIPLSKALSLTQNFLDEFNIIQTKSLFPCYDKAQRRLVKNSFLVELSDGHRKLRHVFLFNDVLVCAKYKTVKEKCNFELKWHAPVTEISVTDHCVDLRDSNTANVIALKSQICTTRDQMLREEQDDKRLRLVGRSSEKYRKKLFDLEVLLTIALPNLGLRVTTKSQRVPNSYVLFFSSEFERSQWIETLEALQQSVQFPRPSSLNLCELQAWISACRDHLQTDFGTYFSRTKREEDLLVGDLQLNLIGLVAPGMDHSGEFYLVVEIDSYGHYFKQAKSRIEKGRTPHWDETFLVELDETQSMRLLLYEECGGKSTLRGKCKQNLNSSWLQSNIVEKVLDLGPAAVKVTFQNITNGVTSRRVPLAKPQGLFGAKIELVSKREKRLVPFIITSCVREVEKRGLCEVGLYRVSGSTPNLTRLRKSFESNSYEAEQLLKEVDVHSVTGVLKLYLREMPEALFTDALYPAFIEAFHNSDSTRNLSLKKVYERLPTVNRSVIDFLLAHLIRINKYEAQNKMSLHNLATVFGPTLLRPGINNSKSDPKSYDPLAAGTVDVMAQAGILYCFLEIFNRKNHSSSL